MKRFFVLLTIALTCLTLFSTASEARRFGGGGSFGKQRAVTPQQTPKAPAAAPEKATSTPQNAGNRWLGPLAGLAMGAAIGSLFAGLGFGQGMGTIVMLLLAGLAVFFLLSMFRSRQRQPAFAAGGNSYTSGQPRSIEGLAEDRSGSDASIPVDFPTASFIRSAKTTFIRLQAANDSRDLNDIREYTTPEMFAEISMQLAERVDASPQKTEVVNLECELIEVVNDGQVAIASVRFVAQLRENGEPEKVDEIWHVHKSLNDKDSVWLLAGIQQTFANS